VRRSFKIASKSYAAAVHYKKKGRKKPEGNVRQCQRHSNTAIRTRLRSNPLYHLLRIAGFNNQLHGVLLEKLTGPQPVKKFLALYGPRRLITAFMRVRHQFLSWAKGSVQIRSVCEWSLTWQVFKVWNLQRFFQPQNVTPPHFKCLRLFIQYICNYPSYL
jgi:hypothetical protein